MTRTKTLLKPRTPHASLPAGSTHRLRRPVRLLLAWLLRSASTALDTLASQLEQSRANESSTTATRLGRTRHIPSTEVASAIEFYAQAGAPEGAIYQDGELLGYLPGVQRL